MTDSKASEDVRQDDPRKAWTSPQVITSALQSTAGGPSPGFAETITLSGNQGSQS